MFPLCIVCLDIIPVHPPGPLMTATDISFLRMDVEKGKIEDTGGSGGSYSIKTQFNSEEQWTKALKFMLTNLKWGLAWVTSQFYNR